MQSWQVLPRASLQRAGDISRRFAAQGILPEQIGRFKIAWHQQFLRAWRATDASARRFSFEDIRKIRERCIAALAR